MRRNLAIIAVAAAFAVTAHADDRPMDFSRLPSSAREFVKANFPDDKVIYVLKDDDLVRPDYTVMLSNGVRIDFEHSGALEKIESADGGIPSAIIPVQIIDYLKHHYPDAVILGYEIGRRSYEVKLSNRLELKFSNRFNLTEIDD